MKARAECQTPRAEIITDSISSNFPAQMCQQKLEKCKQGRSELDGGMGRVQSAERTVFKRRRIIWRRLSVKNLHSKDLREKEK